MIIDSSFKSIGIIFLYTYSQFLLEITQFDLETLRFSRCHSDGNRFPIWFPSQSLSQGWLWIRTDAHYHRENYRHLPPTSRFSYYFILWKINTKRGNLISRSHDPTIIFKITMPKFSRISSWVLIFEPIFFFSTTKIEQISNQDVQNLL